MRFTVTNLLPKENVLLARHTPLEGLQNDVLRVVHIDSGEEVPYEGIVASREAPHRENGSYIRLAAGASRSVTVDLRDAYTFKQPGRYRVTFLPVGGPEDDATAPAEFVLNETVP